MFRQISQLKLSGDLKEQAWAVDEVNSAPSKRVVAQAAEGSMPQQYGLKLGCPGKPQAES